MKTILTVLVAVLGMASTSYAVNADTLNLPDSLTPQSPSGCFEIEYSNGDIVFVCPGDALYAAYTQAMNDAYNNGQTEADFLVVAGGIGPKPETPVTVKMCCCHDTESEEGGFFIGRGDEMWWPCICKWRIPQPIPGCCCE